MADFQRSLWLLGAGRMAGAGAGAGRAVRLVTGPTTCSSPWPWVHRTSLQMISRGPILEDRVEMCDLMGWRFPCAQQTCAGDPALEPLCCAKPRGRVSEWGRHSCALVGLAV